MGIERTDRATLVALARWQVIAQAADTRLSPAQRGLLLSEIAAQTHRDADGRVRRYTTRTLYRWLAAWQTQGFDGLKPARRRDAVTYRTDAEMLALAGALRTQAPARSAPQIAEVIARTRGVVAPARTLQRYLAANGLDRARLAGRMRAYGRLKGRRLRGVCGPLTAGTARRWPSWAAATRSCCRSSTITRG